MTRRSGAGVAQPDQVLGAGDEVGEGVALPEQLAVLVPLAPELPAAPDVGDGEGEPAFEEVEP
jgi:hypothetical protein